MMYHVSFLAEDPKHSIRLCERHYKSDFVALNAVCNEALSKNKQKNKLSKINAVNIYRLVRRGGIGYWKTVFYQYEIL